MLKVLDPVNGRPADFGAKAGAGGGTTCCGSNYRNGRADCRGSQRRSAKRIHARDMCVSSEGVLHIRNRTLVRRRALRAKGSNRFIAARNHRDCNRDPRSRVVTRVSYGDLEIAVPPGGTVGVRATMLADSPGAKFSTAPFTQFVTCGRETPR